jgi:putative transposase
MSEILKSFKFRIYPTLEQEEILAKTFGCSRFVWNHLVENFNSWTPENKPLPLNEKILKDDLRFPFLKEVSAAVLQQKRIDFEETKRQFFNKKRKTKIGRMKFKSKRNRQSFRLPGQKFKIDQENSLIHLEKIGNLHVVLDREIPISDLRSVTVSKYPSGKFFCSVLVKIDMDIKPITGRMVGIDLGLKDLFILSDGQVVNNPKWFRENQSKLKIAQQHLSRKKKGSKRREKQRIKVARIHEKIKNQRMNFHHEVSSALVNIYDVICIEDLNVSGMMKNHCLSKSIQDASWSSFVSLLSYKCSWYGKTLVKIDRFFPSSKTCSDCGFILDKLPLDIREWICPSCGSFHNRDFNAAKNILVRGFSDLSGLEFGSFHKLSSEEYFENSRGEEFSLFGETHHLASSMKRLVTL